MTEINNNYNIKPTFAGKQKPMKQTDKNERIKNLTQKSSEVLSDMMEREVPENGKFTRVFVTFEIPETNNEAIISIEPDRKNIKTQRYLSVGVHHKNKDRMISNFILNGTKKEIFDYLKDNNNQAGIIDKIKELSDKTDAYYNSL